MNRDNLKTFDQMLWWLSFLSGQFGHPYFMLKVIKWWRNWFTIWTIVLVSIIECINSKHWFHIFPISNCYWSWDLVQAAWYQYYVNILNIESGESANWSVEMQMKWKGKVQQWLSPVNLGIDSNGREVLFNNGDNWGIIFIMIINKSQVAFLPGFLSINPLGSCDLGKLLYHHHDNQHLHSPTTSTLTLSWPSTLWMKINIEFSKICYGFPKVYLVNTFIYICICVIIINIGNCNQFWYCPTLLLTRQKYSPASPVLTEVRFKSNLEYVHNILILIS